MLPERSIVFVLHGYLALSVNKHEVRATALGGLWRHGLGSWWEVTHGRAARRGGAGEGESIGGGGVSPGVGLGVVVPGGHRVEVGSCSFPRNGCIVPRAIGKVNDCVAAQLLCDAPGHRGPAPGTGFHTYRSGLRTRARRVGVGVEATAAAVVAAAAAAGAVEASREGAPPPEASAPRRLEPGPPSMTPRQRPWMGLRGQQQLTAAGAGRTGPLKRWLRWLRRGTLSRLVV